MHWWVDADQTFAEQLPFATRDLGRGWQTVPMPNNAERLDPYGSDEASQLLRSAREERVLTALDEGAAWRHRKDRVLIVARVEVFSLADDRAHRSLWQEHATRCLDAVWRERWQEREVEPGWIEARWKPEHAGAVGPHDGDHEDRGADAEHDAAERQIDWITVEDHTSTSVSGIVDRYEHVTMWCGRAVATLTIRHDDAIDVDEVTHDASMATYRRIWQLDD